MPTLIMILVLLAIASHLARISSPCNGWGSAFDARLTSSNLILFGAPISTGLLVAFAAYTNGILQDVGNVFASIFVALIVFNVFYRISGRDRYPVRASAFYLFVIGGSIGSLLLLRIS